MCGPNFASPECAHGFFKGASLPVVKVLCAGVVLLRFCLCISWLLRAGRARSSCEFCFGVPPQIGKRPGSGIRVTLLACSVSGASTRLGEASGGQLRWGPLRLPAPCALVVEPGQGATIDSTPLRRQFHY